MVTRVCSRKSLINLPESKLFHLIVKTRFLVRLRVGVRGYGCRITLQLLYIFQELTGMEFCDAESQGPTKVSATRLLQLQLGSLSQKPRPASLQQICGVKIKRGAVTSRDVDESKITHTRERDGEMKKRGK